MKTLSLLIPIYNEEKRLNKTLIALKNLKLPKSLKLEEVIFVDDGSKDSSKFKIQKLKLHLKKNLKTKITLISHKENRGKGFAVKQGMFASNSDYTLFFDADISTPLSEIKKFLPYINKGIEVITGTRKNSHSTVIKHQPFYREILGRGFTFLSNLILKTDFEDFTCGFKAISKNAKEKIFSLTKIDRWGYDAEILFLTKKLNLSFQEVPVVWANDEETKVNLIVDLPRSFMELVLIRSYDFFNSSQVKYLHLERARG